jgi:hypothetical protein
MINESTIPHPNDFNNLGFDFLPRTGNAHVSALSTAMLLRLQESGDEGEFEGDWGTRRRGDGRRRRTANRARRHKSVVLECAATIFQEPLNFCRFMVVLPTTLCLELGKEIDHQLKTSAKSGFKSLIWIRAGV